MTHTKYISLKKWLINLVLAYAVVVLAITLLQRNLIYLPDTAPFIPAEWALPELETLNVTTADGLM